MDEDNNDLYELLVVSDLDKYLISRYAKN